MRPMRCGPRVALPQVSYVIHGLAKRFEEKSGWLVTLKTLVVFHRLLREVDPSFQVPAAWETGRRLSADPCNCPSGPAGCASFTAPHAPVRFKTVAPMRSCVPLRRS